MRLLDLTLPTPVENIALDEALLERAETSLGFEPVLRLWEPKKPSVVIGRSSRIRNEVNLENCQRLDVPVFRRCSGGASILTAPGCLMYALLLPYESNPELRKLDVIHRFVMQRIQSAIDQCGVMTEFQGTCDLTLGDRKVSGNALRCKKNWVLYHGTLICDSMDLSLIGQCLKEPERQPDYRRARSHGEFVGALPIRIEPLKHALTQIWNCAGPLDNWPDEKTSRLVSEKYQQNEWNFKI